MNECSSLKLPTDWNGAKRAFESRSLIYFHHNSFCDASSGGNEDEEETKKLPRCDSVSAAEDSVCLTLSDKIAKFEASAPSLLLVAGRTDHQDVHKQR